MTAGLCRIGVNELTPRRKKTILALIVAALAISGGTGWFCYERYVAMNFHETVAGQLYRSAQPDPVTLDDWIRQYHLKSVINLNGPRMGHSFRVEKEVTDKAGIQLIHVGLEANALPEGGEFLKLIDALETAPRPILVHCRAGADRSGVACVLGAMAVGGQDYATARGQLSIWYLHVDPISTHVGGVLSQYENYCRQRNIGTGGWQQFKDWAVNVYCRAKTPATASAPATG